MSLEEVNLFCTDCDGCKRALKALRRKQSGGKVRVAKALATGGLSLAAEGASNLVAGGDEGIIREGKGCSLCAHTKGAHQGKIKDPGWAHTPLGGDFDFEPVDAIGIRGVICLQAAATASRMGSGLEVAGEYSIVFLHDRLEIYELRGSQMVADAPYENVRALEIGGPGEQTSGGGFFGGGFGVAGFAVGAAASMVLNKVTTRKSIQTLIRVESQVEGIGSAEWMFLTGVADTTVVDSTLRPITLRLSELARTKEVGPSAAPVSQPAPDKVTRLKELSELRDIGAIDEDEFNRLKNEIMSS